MDLRNNSLDTDDEPVFVHPPSQNLFCPICHELYKNPIITKECGHSFCEVCIFQIENSFCPLCRRKINLSEVHQNLVLDQLVKEMPVYCKFRKLGCNEQFPLVSKAIHEKQCKFGPSRCPHLIRGCKFSGTKVALEEHLKNHCPFEMMKDYLIQNEQQMNEMKKQIERQSSEIKELKRKLDFQPVQRNVSSNLETETKSITEDPRTSPIFGSSRVVHSPSLTEKDRWDILGMQSQQTLAGHTRGVTALTYCIKTGNIYSGSFDTNIRVWSVKSSEDSNSSNEYSCVKVLEGHKGTVWSLVVADSGSKLFSGSADSNIFCWKIETLEKIGQFENTGKVYTMEIKGKLLFSAGGDRKIKIWEVDTFAIVKELQGHTDSIWQLVVHQNKLYSGSDDKSIRVWDLSTYECLQTLLQTNQTQSKVLSVAVGHGYIIGGTDDCKIKIWDSNTYEYKTTLTEHSWEVWQLAISCGLLFSGSFDHTIKVWDLDTLKCIKTLTGHKGYVHSLSLGKNYHLLSGSGDKTIKIWRGFGFS